MSIGIPDNSLVDLARVPADDLAMRGGAQNGYVTADYARTWTMWQAASPETPLETLSYGEALANRGDERALQYIASLTAHRTDRGANAAGPLALAAGKGERGGECTDGGLRGVSIQSVAVADRDDAGASSAPRNRRSAASQRDLAAAHRRDFGAFRHSYVRGVPPLVQLLLADRISASTICNAAGAKLIASFEPDLPWQQDYLHKRAQCYAQAGDPRAARAKRDWQRYLASTPRRLNGEPIKRAAAATLALLFHH